MKVSELIKKLSKFNPDADVSLTMSEDICISFISKDNATPQTTKQLFIEPADYCYTCEYYNDGWCDAYGDEPSNVEECYNYD